ncbi:hypothetical protein [Archangium primigenium]|uniref:hypothetical protein n=1 Tax=[Archangium] primigenium TaxID=2792470 RepID=UPI00195C6A4F|nr:hypothetical protein [Archangium primigenium]MBM7112472.1 hypothetical protein [Archangium primigenium]
MGRTRHPSTWLLAPLAVLGAWLGSPSARAESPPTPETPLTQCGDKQVGPGADQLQPLGQGFYADGARVWRGCTPLLHRPLKNRPPLPFATDTFKPLGCGFVRSSTGIYWDKPLDDQDTVDGADVLTRLDLVDAATFEVDADCRPRDARFLYLNHTAKPALPSFVAVPRGSGQGYDELGCGFVRTEGRVYFGVLLVEGAQAPAFTSVQGRLPAEECGEGLYGKDRQRVWWRQYLVKGAPARLFRVPKEENPGARVGCVGRRSFQLAIADRKPNPVCQPVKKKKPARPVREKKARR